MTVLSSLELPRAPAGALGFWCAARSLRDAAWMMFFLEMVEWDWGGRSALFGNGGLPTCRLAGAG